MLYDFSPVRSRADWKGSEIDYHADGLFQLSPNELAEIQAAVAGLGNVDLPEITRDNFPLPTLGARLADLADELRFGRGFVLMRGLPREAYSADDLARIFYGIGAHLGSVIPQSGDGELLGHVLNVNDHVAGPVRGYRSSDSMNMHSDGHDVVGLLCLRSAKEGGASRIASAVAVHNHMAAERPDLLEALYTGMKLSRMAKDAIRGNGRIVTSEPVALFARPDDDPLSACIHVAQVREAAAAGALPMTALQSEALDMLVSLAASSEFALDMNIGEGDIQFLNNRLILHGRLDYADHPELDRRRHLMRLWLLMPWPDRPQNQQDIYAPDDLPQWARHRTPAMEMPSRYLAEMASLRAGNGH